MSIKEKYITILDNVFHHPDRHESHRKAASILQEMSHNREILFEIIRENLAKDKLFEEKKAGPVIAFDIEINRNYGFSAHCFFPLPNRREDISHNWIHHHDHSLLTTVNAFGNAGYKSMLFNKDYDYNPETQKVTNLKITREFSHPTHNVEFIDAFVPHVVYLPGTLTITYALWSFDRVPRFDRIRSTSIFQRFKAPLKKLTDILEVNEVLDVETETSDRQFAPTNEEFICVGNKLYPVSTNSNYLQNLFYILQETGFDDEHFLEEVKRRAKVRGRKDIMAWVDKLFHSENISDLYDPLQLNISGLNFSRAAVVGAATTP